MIRIGRRAIGGGFPCFVIAEAGVNHNGDVEIAERLVAAAAAAGADAVKFQTFAAERLATAQAPKAEYQREAGDVGESQYEMLRRLELSADAHRHLMERCRQQGVLFLSTPFDEQSADLLEELGVAAFKLPSGEVTNLPFLSHVARKKRPLIISTGMSSLAEVEQVVECVERSGNPEFVLLHCVSSYPAAAEDANLRAMRTLAEAFGKPVGFSDHTDGVEVALAAVALGACVIEKHLTVDRTLAGPDHRSSAEPTEFASLVQGIRRVEQALGDGRKRPRPAEAPIAVAARRSLVAARDLGPGTVLTEELIISLRPGTGLPPSMRPELVGRTLRVAVAAGTPFALEMLA
jgi:N-acetylneuraminate synthase